MEKIRQWMYYCIIGIISIITLGFIPFLGSTLGLDWAIPNTTVGWIVWVATKLIVSGINVLIFHSFMSQAKLNVKEDPNFKEAQNILQNVKEKDHLPRGPRKWKSQQYSKKGITIFITTALGTIALTQAILTYDWVSALSYLFMIIMGIIFGVFQMKSAEEYWTEEYLKYAKLKEKEIKEEKDHDHRREGREENRAAESSGTSPTESE